MYYRRLPKFVYLKPSTIEEACSLVGEHRGDARVLAGGTDLLVRLRQRVFNPEYLISLTGVLVLDYIDYDEQTGLRVGALTTIDSLGNSSIVREKYAVLSQAAGEISALPLHYVSTVGGNICLDTRCIYFNQSSAWRQVRTPCFKRGGDICHVVKGGNRCYSVYQGDLAPALIALEARVKIKRTGAERVIPLSEFFTGSGENPNVLEPNEIVTEIQIPPPSPNTFGSYQKLRMRQALDFPFVGVAAVVTVDGQVFQKVRIVLGAIASAPLEVGEAEEILKGGRAEDSLIDKAAQEAFNRAHPVDNLSMAAGYRRRMIRVLLKRAVKEALDLTRKGK